jgi:hypothetical protein
MARRLGARWLGLSRLGMGLGRLGPWFRMGLGLGIGLVGSRLGLGLVPLLELAALCLQRLGTLVVRQSGLCLRLSLLIISAAECCRLAA